MPTKFVLCTLILLRCMAAPAQPHTLAIYTDNEALMASAVHFYDLEAHKKLGSVKEKEASYKLYQNPITGKVYVTNDSKLYEAVVVNGKPQLKYLFKTDGDLTGNLLAGWWVEEENYNGILALTSVDNAADKKRIPLPHDDGVFPNFQYINERYLAVHFFVDKGKPSYIEVLDVGEETVVKKIVLPDSLRHLGDDDFRITPDLKWLLFNYTDRSNNQYRTYIAKLDLTKAQAVPEELKLVTARMNEVLNDSLIRIWDMEDYEERLYNIYTDTKRSGQPSDNLWHIGDDARCNVAWLTPAIYNSDTAFFNGNIGELFVMPPLKPVVAVKPVVTAQLSIVLQGREQLEKIRYTANGEYFVGMNGKSLSVWDAQTNLLLRSIPTDCYVQEVWMDTANTTITDACGNSYDLATGKLQKKANYPGTVFVSPDKSICVVKATEQIWDASKGQTYNLLNPESGNEIGQITKVKDDANGLMITSDGKYAVYEQDNAIKVLDLATRIQQNSFVPQPPQRAEKWFSIYKTERPDIIRVEFPKQNDKSYLNQYQCFYNLITGKKVSTTAEGWRNDGENIVFSADGRYYADIYTETEDRNAFVLNPQRWQVHDFTSGKVVGDFEMPGEVELASRKCLGFSPDANFVLFADAEEQTWLRIYTVGNANLVNAMPLGQKGQVERVSYSSARDALVFATGDTRFTLGLSGENGIFLQQQTSELRDFAFADAHLQCTYQYSDSVRYEYRYCLQDNEGNNLTDTLVFKNEGVMDADLSADRKQVAFLIFSKGKYYLQTYSLENKKIKRSPLLGFAYKVRYTENGKDLLLWSYTSTYRFDASSCSFRDSLNREAKSFLLIPDSNLIICQYSYGETVFYYDLSLHLREKKLGDNDGVLCINESKTQLISAVSDRLNFYSVSNFKKLRSITLSSPLDYVESIFTTRNDKYIVVCELDRIQVFDYQNGQRVLQVPVLQNGGVILLNDEGYYYNPQKATQALAFSYGNKAYPFDQFDLKFNRPDLVLAALAQHGAAIDTALAHSYYRAWQKRMSRLGIDTQALQSGLHVPLCEIKNRKAISYLQTRPNLPLVLQAADSSSTLISYNVWVNECPLYGTRGRSIAHGQKNTEIPLEVPLSYGLNRIELTVTNRLGIESYRSPLYVNYLPADTPPSKLYFIGLGINRFKESGHDLQWCVKDISDLGDSLQQHYGKNMLRKTLYNEQLTNSNVNQLKQWLMQTTANDKVIVAYSGHGLLNKDYDYFLSAYDVNFATPEKGGIPYDDLELLLDSIPARQKLMLLDACHSGELDKEELQSMRKRVNDLARTGSGIKGEPVDEEDSDNTNNFGLKRSFELMQDLFVNLKRGTGATVISAASGTQVAQENGQLKNGIFTYAILALLAQEPKAVKVSELKNYVNKEVSARTHGLQQPTSRTETIDNDWLVW